MWTCYHKADAVQSKTVAAKRLGNKLMDLEKAVTTKEYRRIEDDLDELRQKLESGNVTLPPDAAACLNKIQKMIKPPPPPAEERLYYTTPPQIARCWILPAPLHKLPAINTGPYP